MEKAGAGFNMNTRIPVNATAIISLPATNVNTVREGGRNIAGRADLKIIKTEQGRVLIKAGSGNYTFTVN